MEEQRQRYGPPLYSLTTMVLNIRLFLSLLLGRFEASKPWVTLKSFLFTAKIVGCILYLAHVVVFFLNIFWLLFIEQTEASNCYLGRSSWHIYLRVWKIHQISWVLFFDFCFIGVIFFTSFGIGFWCWRCWCLWCIHCSLLLCFFNWFVYHVCILAVIMLIVFLAGVLWGLR